MKKVISCILTASVILAIASGCKSSASDSVPQTTQNSSTPAELQNASEEASEDTYQTSAEQTEEISLPPADTDCFAVADECALGFQSLFLNYLQYEVKKRSICVEDDSKRIDREGTLPLYPVVDDKIKCYNDLKSIFLEYCTDKYADELLQNPGFYEDIDGKLYWSDNVYGTIVKGMGVCCIKDCRIDGNKMIVGLILMGTDNEYFPQDIVDTYFVAPNDIPFTMTLVWQNDKWLISDCSREDALGYLYRSYPVYFQNSSEEASEDTYPTSEEQTEEISLPPADTDCFAVADECALGFQSLFLNYLQYEVKNRSIKCEEDNSKRIDREGMRPLYPVVDDKIKCYDDLKSIFLEYCTDKYAEELLQDSGDYKDIDGKLYWSDNDYGTIIKMSGICCIKNCRIDGNKMIVDLIKMGIDNEYFPQDIVDTYFVPSHDIPFTMTLVWQNDKWLISDCSTYEASLGYLYRSYPVYFQNSSEEASEDTYQTSAEQTEETTLPPSEKNKDIIDP